MQYISGSGIVANIECIIQRINVI
ncbi:hypothetical protein YPPY11_0525, partial [Yersinia pestis PY-11]